MSHLSGYNFSFQYYIDLGNQKISNIFINQDSDPYVEASKFCAKLSLPAIIVTILGDAIKEQIQEEKELADNKRGNKQTNPMKNIHENISRPSIFDTMTTELKEEINESGCVFDQLMDSIAEVNNNQRANVFENLYNNYKIIEKKKEMSRKKSFQSIPFRPQINQLSKKIVRHKRKRSQSQINEERNELKDISQNNCKEDRWNPSILYRKIVVNNGSQKNSVSKLGNVSKSKMQNDIFQRSEVNRKKSEQKRKKILNSIQQKLMQSCSFKPTINIHKNRIL